MNTQPHEQSGHEHGDMPAKSPGATRRDLIRKSPLAPAAGSIALPPLLAGRPVKPKLLRQTMA
jgi:hypothetical protein